MLSVSRYTMVNIQFRRVEQAQRFHQYTMKEQQITSVLTTADKKTCNKKPGCLKQEK